MNKFLEWSNDYAWEDRRCILQSKQHYRVMEITPLSREVCLAPIFWHDFDLVVPREPIREGICLLATYIVQHFITWRELGKDHGCKHHSTFWDPCVSLFKPSTSSPIPPLGLPSQILAQIQWCLSWASFLALRGPYPYTLDWDGKVFA